jgi:hypothetical protein
MIKWRKGSNIIEWSQQHNNSLIIQKAVFCRAGTLESDNVCRNDLVMFTELSIQRRDQFAWIENIIFEQLWGALISLYGYPELNGERKDL